MELVRRKIETSLKPRLRFKGFSGEWVLRKLGDITEKINSGKTPLGGQSVYQNEGIIFIRSQNVVDDQLVLAHCTFISEEINQQMKNSIVERNDILLNITGASLGRSCVVPVDFKMGNVNQHVCIIRLCQGYEAKFVQPILSSQKGQNILISLQTGSGREGLNFQSIRTIQIALPPTHQEQQKIASFLSAVDDKIRQLKRKKELLEQYKKGVMQQVFSGKLRFKDENGKEYPEWVEKRLGDAASPEIKWSFTGGPFGSNLRAEDYTSNGIRILQLQNIGDGEFLDDYKIYTSRKKADELLSCNIYPGEILISKMGDPVARACKVPQQDSRYLMASDGIRLVPDQKIFERDFVLYSINASEFRKKAIELSTGSTRKRIGLSELKQIKIPMPHLSEQRKIALLISSFDKTIATVTKTVALAEAFKKGLLQKLFV